MAMGRYDPIIADASRRFGVPENRIRAVMGVESGGRADAVSPKGAAGLMQVMAPTYADLAKRHGFGPDRFDPTNNIMAGTAYLGEMYERFGNWDEALGAYNAGPGRMRQVKAGQRGMPAETRAYVPAVNARLGDDVAGYRTSYNGPGATYEAGPEFAAMLENIRLNGPPPLTNRVGAGDDLGPDERRQFDQLISRFEQGGASMIPDAQVNGWMGRAGSGLLDVDENKNYAEGLGGLLNVGQTPSDPPRTQGAVAEVPSQTDRLGINDRLNGVMRQLLDPQSQRPRMGQGGYMMAGALGAVSPLAATRDRKVGIGELLGALGGGLTRGAMAGQQAQREDLRDQFGNLVSATKLDEYQRGEATRQRQAQGVATLAAQLRKDGRVQEAQMLEANPALLTEFAKEKFKAPEAYTLAPGAQRRDAAGNVIAQNPHTPPAPRQAQTVQTAEGVFVLNPDGTTGQRVGSPVTAVQKQTPQEREAILESDKKLEAGVTTIGTLRQALALNKKAFSGVTAGARAWADRIAPGEWGGTATTEFQNLIESGLLSQMKDIFGSNPTEGERKALLDLGASVNKSEAEREVILNNAIAAAEARLARERQRADALRKGTYYTEGLPEPGAGGSGGGNPPPPPDGFTVR